ncbi:MAG: winged helix-turn-helix transcriptional regulator, partial [Lachnospiraceae bacterium]|nr:winged helix-turn-helix transcriptional regulator [Lachnospiraceae bacterium]
IQVNPRCCKSEVITYCLFSVREFGNNCLLYTLDELLRYGDVINVLQADEEDRIVERNEVPLFDNKAFREAVINAVLHNQWTSWNEPMISVFSDRVEILSRGSIPPAQTMEGFFLGESIPVNEKLSEIFLQLHISEKSGRGVPKITETYGRDAFTFRENSIVVTIPFDRVDEVRNKVGNKVGNKKPLNSRRQRILGEMRDNPNVTTAELHRLIGVSETAIEKNIAVLKENGYVERVGSKKSGYWKVKD